LGQDFTRQALTLGPEDEEHGRAELDLRKRLTAARYEGDPLAGRAVELDQWDAEERTG
jgi:hypothetical protein